MPDPGRMRRRLEMLARAGEVLSGSLEPDATHPISVTAEGSGIVAWRYKVS